MAENKDQNSWNNDPVKQDKDVDGMQKTAPNDSAKPADKSVPHSALDEDNKLKSSGKDIGLVSAPVQSINPTSGNQTQDEAPKFDIIDKPNRFLNRDGEVTFAYPLQDLDVDQGIFIPVPPGGTTDALIDKVHNEIAKFRDMNAECEKDIKGDDVWESVVIQTKKRTTDGLIQLDSNGKPIVGANQTNRPKMIHSSNFVVRPVVKDDEISEGKKAEGDGALVVRVL